MPLPPLALDQQNSRLVANRNQNQLLLGSIWRKLCLSINGLIWPHSTNADRLTNPPPPREPRTMQKQSQRVIHRPRPSVVVPFGQLPATQQIKSSRWAAAQMGAFQLQSLPSSRQLMWSTQIQVGSLCIADGSHNRCWRPAARRSSSSRKLSSHGDGLSQTRSLAARREVIFWTRKRSMNNWWN